MSDYVKTVEASFTGLVTAQVFAPDGRRTGLRFWDASGWFSGFSVNPKRLDAMMGKAHKWADEMIAVCERMEST